MKRIDALSKEACCGCGACGASCPVSAIRMERNEEGFDYPQIDETICIKCGKCMRACGVFHADAMKNPLPLECWAMWSADDVVRAKSTSGGAFTVLARRVLADGGVVVGAAFSDDFHRVFHIVAHHEYELAKLRESKYVQSDSTAVMGETLRLLKEGRKVFFVGTPCQVASVKALCQGNDENLFTADIVCHGVPSPGVFEQYLKEEEARSNGKVTSYHFRDKTSGWNFPKIAFRAGKKSVKRIPALDAYFFGFSLNAFLRKSCYQCPFATPQRVGDFTIADCWRVATLDSSLDDNKGTSLLLVNTAKAKELFARISERQQGKVISYDYACQHNEPLLKPAKELASRERFFRVLGETNSFESAAKTYQTTKRNFINLAKFWIKKLGWFYWKKHQ